MRFSRWIAVLAGILLAAAGSACTPISSDPPALTAADRLPAYKGSPVELFDDAIEPHAVGLELDNYVAPRTDPRLRARAQTADIVVRGRVTTVTGEMEAGTRVYQVSFHKLERLAGKRPVGDDFTVRVDSASPALGIVRSMEGQLVGKTLDVFVKAFAHPGSDTDRDLHFHAMADAPDVAAAVKEAVVLDEVK